MGAYYLPSSPQNPTHPSLHLSKFWSQSAREHSERLKIGIWGGEGLSMLSLFFEMKITFLVQLQRLTVKLHI